MTIVEQEKVVNEKVQIIEDLRRDLENVQATSKAKDAEVKDAKERLDECLQKLRESRDKMKENENGLLWFCRLLFLLLTICLVVGLEHSIAVCGLHPSRCSAAPFSFLTTLLMT